MKNNLIISICVAGIFLGLILLVNFVFDLFKVWNWSIQMFLIIYAIGIYKIKNIIVNICFLIVTPPLLFVMENGAYVINGLQVFFEYFLVFYIFALLYVSTFISSLFKNKKHYLIIDSIIFIISFSILIIIKYFLHCCASIIWWGSNNWSAALIYNSTWFAANSLTIPVVAIITTPIFLLLNKLYQNELNKW